MQLAVLRDLPWTSVQQTSLWPCLVALAVAEGNLRFVPRSSDTGFRCRLLLQFGKRDSAAQGTTQ